MRKMVSSRRKEVRYSMIRTFPLALYVLYARSSLRDHTIFDCSQAHIADESASGQKFTVDVVLDFPSHHYG